MSDTEEAAQLVNDAIEAMMTLVAEHGYTEADLQRLVHDAVRNA